jgi:hypothetical protein
LFLIFNQVGYHHLVSCVSSLRTTFLFFGVLIFYVYREGLPVGHCGCVSPGEAVDPEAPALVPPGLCQGRGLTHGIGVPVAAERAMAERDAGRE